MKNAESNPRDEPRGSSGHFSGAPIYFKSACEYAPMHRPHDGTGRHDDRDEDRNDALAGERRRAAIVGEDKGFARIFRSERLNFGSLFLRGRQYEGGDGGNARECDHAKSAIRMRFRAKAVSVNDLYCRAESDQQQTNNSEKLFSEEPGARLGSRLEHSILGFREEKNGRKGRNCK